MSEDTSNCLGVAAVAGVGEFVLEVCCLGVGAWSLSGTAEVKCWQAQAYVDESGRLRKRP